jgi:hypothetical protein
MAQDRLERKRCRPGSHFRATSDSPSFHLRYYLRIGGRIKYPPLTIGVEADTTRLLQATTLLIVSCRRHSFVARSRTFGMTHKHLCESVTILR